MNCFGTSERDSGQSRLPIPPQRITGVGLHLSCTFIALTRLPILENHSSDHFVDCVAPELDRSISEHRIAPSVFGHYEKLYIWVLSCRSQQRKHGCTCWSQVRSRIVIAPLAILAMVVHRSRDSTRWGPRRVPWRRGLVWRCGRGCGAPLRVTPRLAPRPALSGGTDSTNILCTMLATGRPPRCYTIFAEGTISSDLLASRP